MHPSIRQAAIFVSYLLIAIVMTYPLIMQMGSVFAGFPYGDAYENARHVWWFGHALRTGEPLFYQTLLAYPGGVEGITLQSNLLQYFPAWLFALVLPLPVANNLHVLLTLAFNGWAMYALARHLTGQPLAAWVAGVIFMAFPTLQGHLGAAHSGLIVQWPLAIYALALVRIAEARQGGRVLRGAVLLAALSLMLTAFTHPMQLLYAAAPVTSLIAIRLLLRRHWGRLIAVGAACLMGTAVLALYLLPLMQETSAYADEGGSVRYSADLLAALSPSFLHPLYDALDYPRRVLGINLDEGAAYAGLVAGTLAVIGLWRARAARGWVWLGLAAYVLSLGPLLKLFDQPVTLVIEGHISHIALPWAAVQGWPLLALARTPGRFNFILGLALAVMAAYGAAWLLGQIPHVKGRRAAVLLLAGLIVFDYQMFWPLPATTAAIPAGVAALRGRDGVRAIFDIPWDDLLVAKEALYFQTAHEQPLIAGQVTRRTTVDPAFLSVLQTTLDPAHLRAAGADIVLLHKLGDASGALAARAREQLGAPIYEDDRIAVFETPPTDAPPSAVVLNAPMGAVGDQAQTYLFAPEAGWLVIEAELSADDRTAELRLGGEPFWRSEVNGDSSLRLPVSLSDPGYHTLTLAVLPPCPAYIPAGLACRSVDLRRWTIVGEDDEQTQRIAFGDEVALADAYWPPQAQAGAPLELWLSWRFGQGRSADDVRFVHLLDEAGMMAAQSDVSLGLLPAGTRLDEAVVVDLPSSLPAGRYELYAGWYRFPDLVRLPVLAQTTHAADGLALLGTVEVVAR